MGKIAPMLNKRQRESSVKTLHSPIFEIACRVVEFCLGAQYKIILIFIKSILRMRTYQKRQYKRDTHAPKPEKEIST